MSSSEESSSDYSEENLDDFIKNASQVLSEEKHPDRETIVESLKQHLSSIFNDEQEMENLFKTLNSIIFSSSDKSKKLNSQKISDKKPFKLYPLIFSFNPKSSFFYVDYFLTSLQQCTTEENRAEFPYLSGIFAEVITAFYSEPGKNKNLLKKNYVLEPKNRTKLYEKLLNFCNNNIKKNKKTEQSFGCLLLTEFLEKCPMTKETKNLENLVNIISEYLDDRWFECKLDLLNCTISLIFTGEKKFKPYANNILCKIIDYLTDEEWLKRKLAINIVYTLLFYCKEEVLADKDNFMDFLMACKDDPVSEVRKVCLQTLNIIKESDPNNVDQEEEEMVIEENNENELNNKTKEENKKSGNKINNNKINNQKKKKPKEENLMVKLQKQKEKIEKMQIEYNKKKIKIDNTKKVIKGQKLDKNAKTIEDDDSDVEKEKEFNNRINSSLYEILQQLKKIKEEQNELYSLYDDVKKTVDNNYINLTDRIKAIERRYPKYLFNNSSNRKKSK